MTIALDHVPTTRSLRIFRAIRVWLSECHHYWFVETASPSDPLQTMSAQDWADLPAWHPTNPEE
jgi:hypothetical protein